MDLIFSGLCEGTNEPVTVRAPCNLYEADIVDGVIVSYTWLGEKGFDVSPRRHGISCGDEQGRIWISGVPSSGVCSSVIPLSIRHTSVQPKRALDLFSGTGSATKVLRAHGFDVVTVDIEKKWMATHPVDILT